MTGEAWGAPPPAIADYAVIGNTRRRTRGPGPRWPRWNHLIDHGFVHRSPDGFDEGEGTFLACSFWLVENLALTGRTGEAYTLFERLLGCANDFGLLAERVDPADGAALGTSPRRSPTSGLSAPPWHSSGPMPSGMADHPRAVSRSGSVRQQPI